VSQGPPASRRVFRWSAEALLALLLLSTLSCIGGDIIKRELREAFQESWSRDTEEAAEEGRSSDPRVAELDSIFRLIRQDVGIDPEEGSVQWAIWRLRVIKLNIRTARQALDNSREEIFGIGATAEEIAALKEMDAELEDAEGEQREELAERRRRFQEEAIQRSKEEGRLQRKKLGRRQAKRVGLLLYNLGVGVICDHLVIQHGEHVLDDFERVKRDLFDKGGAEGLKTWGSLIHHRIEFLKIPESLGQILLEVPGQLKALGAMISTIRVLRENNRIEERRPAAGDGFESMEDF